MRPVASLPLFVAAAVAQATAGPYGQCGGIGYSGPSACGSGYGCTTYNPYYAQCYPGVVDTPTSTPSSTSTSSPRTTSTTRTSTSTTTTIRDSPTTTTRTTPTSGSAATPTTLEPGWYWIRGVASPYFHSYLQAVVPTAATTSSPSPSTNAMLSKPANAGQFNIVSGQLVWHRFSGQPPLYMHVENPADKTQRKLRTWFEASQNTYGSFAFQGDTLTWSVSDINRPNNAAWLVCAGDELFVNTGAFLYQTPAGCFDHTIHSYGGSTADV